MKLIRHLLTACLVIMLSACSSDFDFEEIQDNLPFISLSTEADINNLNEEQLNVVISTLPRFKIFINEDGLYETPIKSADEIFVTDNIFEYVSLLIKGSNEMLLFQCGSERSQILSRSNNEVRADCVPIAIGKALGLNDDKQNSLNAFVRDEYKEEGVPLDKIKSIIAQYNNGGQILEVSPSYFRSGEVLGNNYIIVYRTGLNSGHAVNGIRVADIVEGQDADRLHFFYNDYQNKNTNYVIEDNIYTIFICL